MISRQLAFIFTILIGSLYLSCTFKLNGYSINPDVKTFYVGQIKLTALNAPATLNQTFAESFKDKISRESKLKYSDEAPDIEFNGTIQSFNVEAKAPQPGERTSFNRLTITVNIEYVNHKDAKDTWTKSFSHFDDFPPEQNLLQVQDEKIDIIFKQILEDIFNQAFNNW